MKHRTRGLSGAITLVVAMVFLLSVTAVKANDEGCGDGEIRIPTDPRVVLCYGVVNNQNVEHLSATEPLTSKVVWALPGEAGTVDDPLPTRAMREGTGWGEESNGTNVRESKPDEWVPSLSPNEFATADAPHCQTPNGVCVARVWFLIQHPEPQPSEDHGQGNGGWAEADAIDITSAWGVQPFWGRVLPGGVNLLDEAGGQVGQLPLNREFQTVGWPRKVGDETQWSISTIEAQPITGWVNQNHIQFAGYSSLVMRTYPDFTIFTPVYQQGEATLTLVFDIGVGNLSDQPFTLYFRQQLVPRDQYVIDADNTLTVSQSFLDCCNDWRNLDDWQLVVGERG